MTTLQGLPKTNQLNPNIHSWRPIQPTWPQS